jgi:hypothetical protein
MPDTIVAYRLFTDRIRRPIFEEPSGRQYIISDDDGSRTYGVYFIPPEECLPTVILTEEERNAPTEGSNLDHF